MFDGAKVSSLPETTIQRRSHHLIYLVLCSSWFFFLFVLHTKCTRLYTYICVRPKRPAICLIYQHKFCVSSFKWSSFRSPDKVFGINISLFQRFDEIESSSFRLFTYTYTQVYVISSEILWFWWIFINAEKNSTWSINEKYKIEEGV